MPEHRNLYYLFLEEQQQNLMPEDRNREIRKNLENYFKKIKPPWNSRPPTISEEKSP